MKTKNIVLILTILLVVVILGVFFGLEKREVRAPTVKNNEKTKESTKTASTTKITTSTKETLSEIDTSNWKTYRNEEFGFEIKYPEGWSASETNDYYSFVVKDKSESFLYIGIPPLGFSYDENEAKVSFAIIDSNTKVEILEFDHYFVVSFKKDGTEMLLRFKYNGNRQYYTNLFNNILSNLKLYSSSVDTSNWKTYRNEEFGFEIKYPNGWGIIDESVDSNSLSVYIGDKSKYGKGYGYDGDIFLFARYEAISSIEELVNKKGSQFSDKKVNIEDIYIDGVEAFKTVVSTDEFPNWYSQSVIIEDEGKIYSVNTGRKEKILFDAIYKTFNFLK